jgi:transcriptional regulator with XRE-family HTH domain
MDFRQLLGKLGFTQYRLAELSGVEQTTISQLSLGKVRDPRWSTLSALSVTMNVPPGVIAQAIARTKAKPKPKAKRRAA